ncbi:MAG: hypothetical protein P1U56_13550 [Saprospiraceae bacterium]|nr:hypothetical protein [Saprospiraceae bacterium]
MWRKVTVYTPRTKLYVLLFGLLIGFIMLGYAIISSLNMDTFYILSCLSVFAGMTFGLQYYYQIIQLQIYSPPLKDPYFIVASAYILFGLSTIIILAAQPLMYGKSSMQFTWILRQAFYLIYNIIIAYSFYILYKHQLKEE